MQRRPRGPLGRSDTDRRIEGSRVEEFDHVGVFHADASVRGRTPNPAFLVRAVNINEAIVCVQVLFFCASQAEDTSEHKVVLRGLRRIPFVNRKTALEDREKGRAGTKLLADFE